MTKSREFEAWLVGFILCLFGIVLHSCGHDDTSATDCSRQNKPQYYDEQRQDWTCADRDKKR